MAFYNPNLQRKDNWPKWLLLKALSLIYGAGVECRLGMYRWGIVSPATVRVPVVSVGNITVGGTGKTPLIGWLAEYFDRGGLQAAVVTRGYKAKRKSRLQVLNRYAAAHGKWEPFGDEPWLLWQDRPDMQVYISPDRAAAARKAQQDAQILLLDDGMQHIKLARDLNIVLIDATNGIGNGRLIPLGPLREPLKSLKRADAILFTKANLVAGNRDLKRLIRPIAPQVPLYDCDYLPVHLVSSRSGKKIAPSALEGRACLLVSGIGNPRAFEFAVKSVGGRIVRHLDFPDHFAYGEKFPAELSRLANRDRIDRVICTEKDWVKLERWRKELPEIFRLKMVVRPESAFVEFLDAFRKSLKR